MENKYRYGSHTVTRLTSIRQICLKNSKKPIVCTYKLLLLLDRIVGVGDVVPEYNL